MDLLDTLKKKKEYPPDLKWYTYEEMLTAINRDNPEPWSYQKMRRFVTQKLKTGEYIRKMCSNGQASVAYFALNPDKKS